MAKYDVTMSCGHTKTIELFGKMDERYKKIEWLEKYGLCDECNKALQTERAIANGLPELTGTEKQVNWALSIREKILSEVDAVSEKYKINSKTHEEWLKAEVQGKAIKKVLGKFTEARFWIDNRDRSVKTIIALNKLSDEIRAEFANLFIIAANEDTSAVDESDVATASTAEVVTSDVDDDDDDDELIDEPEIDTTVTSVEENTGAKFEFGKTYNAGNIAVTIINRTEKTVVLKVERLGGMRNDHKVLAENIRKRVKINKNGSEFVTVQLADYGKVDINSESEMDYQKYLEEYTEIHQVKDSVEEVEEIIDNAIEGETAEESAVEEVQEVAETPQVEVNTLSIAELDAIHCQLFCADDTCSTLKGDDTASLQAELENAENEVEMCRQDVDESERLLAYYRRMYIETIAKLAVIEDKITEYGLILHEDKKALADVETCAVAIRAQIDSQKYSAQKLLDAVNSVDNTVSVDTITFELQKFTGSECEEKIEELETKFRADEKDTNTELTPASTFTGLVDSDDEEDAKFDELTESLVEELSNYESEIEKLRGRIAELEDAIEETTQELDKHEEKLTQYMRDKIKFKSTREVPKNLAGAIMPVIPQHEDGVAVNLNAWSLESGALQVRINKCSGEILIEYHSGWHVLLAEYNSVTKFKAAIRELAAAIKRGETQFKFPDDNPKNKKAAS